MAIDLLGLVAAIERLDIWLVLRTFDPRVCTVAQQSFIKLLEIEKMPDLVATIMSGEVSLSKVWKFRNSKISNEFREWFDQKDPIDPDDLVKEYVSSLRSGNILSSRKSKIIRFFVLQAIGAGLIPVTSGTSFLTTLGLSAVDCFLLDKIRFGFKPRYYIDELRNLFPK